MHHLPCNCLTRTHPKPSEYTSEVTTSYAPMSRTILVEASELAPFFKVCVKLLQNPGCDLASPDWCYPEMSGHSLFITRVPCHFPNETSFLSVSSNSGPRSNLFPAFVRARWLRPPFGSLGPRHAVRSLRGRTFRPAGYVGISSAGV